MGNSLPCLRKGCTHDKFDHKHGQGVCMRCQCFQYAHDTRPAYERLR
jgi:hypothetical protein